MKISSVTTNNFLGSSRSIEIEQPVAVVCGPNGSGKSTIREAIKLAFTSTPDRVSMVKDYPQLISEGQTKGGVAVTYDDKEIAVVLPSGKVTAPEGLPQHAALPILLDPALFTSMKADERRTLLYDITKSKASGAVVLAKLEKRGANVDLANQAATMLKTGGFKAAEEYCAEEAKKFKQSFRVISGTNWGKDKSGEWVATAPAFDAKKYEALKVEVAEDTQRHEAAAIEYATAKQQLRAFVDATAQRAERAEKIKALPRLLKKLETDQAEHEKWKAEVERLESLPGTGPRVGLVHELAKALDELLDVPAVDEVNCLEADAARAVRNKYEAQFGKVKDAVGDPNTPELLKKAREAADLCARTVKNDHRDIAAAENAKMETETEVKDPGEEHVASLERNMMTIRSRIAAANDQLSEMAGNKVMADSAEDNTRKAAEAHEAVLQWLTLKDAFAPDGIPSEILAEALAPVNKLLAKLSADAQWRKVSIGDDMMVYAGDRPFALHSESEQWRIQAVCAIALASLSGLKFVALDRFDVLDLPGRTDLFELLDISVELGYLEQAMIFGTLKAAPDLEGYDVFWIGE